MSYGTETYEESGSTGNDYYCYENGYYYRAARPRDDR